MSDAKIYRFSKELFNMTLKSSHEVVVEENGKKVKTTYRLVEGDSELDIRKQRKDAEPIRFNVASLEMVVEDETIQRFLESRPDFGKNIKMYDPIEESKKALKNTEKSINLLKTIVVFENDKIIELGYALFGREALEDVKDGNIAHLTNKILAKAQEDPEYVDNLLNDSKNKERLFASLLIGKGIFEVSIDERYVNWGDNGALVLSVPNGLTALDALTEYLISKEGVEVKKEAGARLEKSITATATAKPKAGRTSKNEVETVIEDEE